MTTRTELTGFIDDDAEIGWPLDEKAKAERWWQKRKRLGMAVKVVAETFDEETGRILHHEPVYG